MLIVAHLGSVLELKQIVCKLSFLFIKKKPCKFRFHCYLHYGLFAIRGQCVTGCSLLLPKPSGSRLQTSRFILFPQLFRCFFYISQFHLIPQALILPQGCCSRLRVHSSSMVLQIHLHRTCSDGVEPCSGRNRIMHIWKRATAFFWSSCTWKLKKSK